MGYDVYAWTTGFQIVLNNITKVSHSLQSGVDDLDLYGAIPGVTVGILIYLGYLLLSILCVILV